MCAHRWSHWWPRLIRRITKRLSLHPYLFPGVIVDEVFVPIQNAMITILKSRTKWATWLSWARFGCCYFYSTTQSSHWRTLLTDVLCSWDAAEKRVYEHLKHSKRIIYQLRFEMHAGGHINIPMSDAIMNLLRGPFECEVCTITGN